MKTNLLRKISKEIRIIKVRKIYYLQKKSFYDQWVNLRHSHNLNDLIYYKHVEMALILGKLGYADKFLKKRNGNL